MLSGQGEGQPIDCGRDLEEARKTCPPAGSSAEQADMRELVVNRSLSEQNNSLPEPTGSIKTV